VKVRILCTLGPASLREEVITALDQRGVDLFRINLSHTPVEAVEETIAFVRRHSPTPICLDTQGAQVRCGPLPVDYVLAQGRTIRLTAGDEQAGPGSLGLWPASVFASLQEGSRLAVDFDGATLEVTATGDGWADAVVVAPGRVRSNRAVTVAPPVPLPALTERDLQAIEVGRQMGITHYALSFASSGEDVELLRGMIPPGSSLISKIESRAGVRNMDPIISASDAVLIDRGDLSREVPIEYVPLYQKVIIRRANRWNRPVFVATNLLESMVTNRLPTVAEANDIANTLLDGVHGLVLAAETAVGIDPVGSVDMVLRSIRAFERSNLGGLLEEDAVGFAADLTNVG
jgi:pyruvate kinase